jgi:hypothetical protein
MYVEDKGNEVVGTKEKVVAVATVVAVSSSIVWGENRIVIINKYTLNIQVQHVII